jgi:hypothetical protein
MWGCGKGTIIVGEVGGMPDERVSKKKDKKKPPPPPPTTTTTTTLTT